VPVPVARHLPRIDRIHRVTRRDQRLHPGSLVGLDTDRHLIGPGLLDQMRTDQLVQPGDPGYPLRQPRPRQPAAGLVLHLHIMMIFSPVVADEQHPASSLALLLSTAAWRRTRDLMDQCSRHDTPSAVRSPHDQRGHCLDLGIEYPVERVLIPPAATGPESAVGQPR
jgi:hypothetical protein